MAPNIPKGPTIPTRCCICLSFLRKMSPLKDRELLILLCPTFFNYNKFSGNHFVCWECKLIIQKIKVFQNKLKISQFFKTLSISKNVSLTAGMSTLQCTEIITVHILPGMPDEIKKPDEQLPRLHQQQLSNTNKKISGPVVVMPITKSSKLVKHLLVPTSTASDFEELIQPTAILSKASNDTTTSPAVISDSTEELTDEEIISNSEVFVQKPALVNKNIDKISDEIKKTFQEHIKIPDIGVEEVIQYLEFEDYKTLAFLFDNDKSKSYVRGAEKDYELKLISRSEVLKFRNEQKSRHAYKWSVFQCELCIDQFPNSQELKAHSLQHEPAYGDYECDICELRFTNEVLRDDHYKGHFIVFQCLKCTYRTNDVKKMSKHITLLHGDVKFVCEPCCQVFKNMNEKFHHIKTVHITNKVDKTNKVPQDPLHQDVQVNSAEKLEQSKNAPKKPKVFIYPIRNRNNKMGHINHHMKIHKMPKQRKKTAPNDSHLASKIYKRKETIAVKCHHCEEFFTGKAAMKAHIYSLTRNLSCTTCRKKFSSRREFRKHVVWAHESDSVPEQEMDVQEIKIENEEFNTEVLETEMDIEEIQIEDGEFTTEIGEESEEIYTEVEFIKSEDDSDTDIDKIKLEIDDITTEEYIIS
ncbi:zinc finger and BTB domain-containing protein 17-like [Helicoverpa zea]|uniref:zinc finger and BTB domain-containing protein 17-like n=1 Tax=Helicoverpa zea TaxID=7113 RepID=UPI001F55FB08|nr:zinc finger and BTB domain-containing protein 17-like [Helicoverpa zea]